MRAEVINESRAGRVTKVSLESSDAADEMLLTNIFHCMCKGGIITVEIVDREGRFEWTATGEDET